MVLSSLGTITKNYSSFLVSYSIKQLRELSDEQLIKEHDDRAKNTVMGTNYYMEELDRRSREKFERTTNRLSWLSAIASITAVITSIITLLK